MITDDVYKEFISKSTLMLSIFNRDKILIALHNPMNNYIFQRVEDQIGKSIDEIIKIPEVAVVLNESFDNTLTTGESTEADYRVTVDNECRYYRFVSVLLDDGNVAISIADISKTKTEELNQKMHTNFLYAILDKVPTAIILKDCETKKYVFWNKHSEIYSKISSKDAIGKVDADLFDENVCRHFEQSDAMLLQNRIPQQVKQVLKINGETFHSMVRKYIVNIDQKDYILGVRWDITELEREKHKSQLIFDNIDTGFIFLSPDYKVEWENVSRVFKHPIVDAYKVGSICYHQGRGKDKPCPNCVMQRALSSRDVEYHSVTMPNGSELSITASPVYEDGMNLGVVLKIDDITNQLAQERELKDAKNKAEESDRLKSLFLANMSHEIRTPLNAIVGFSDLLVDSEDQAEKEEYGAIITNNANLLLSLINDILDLSKIEAGLFTFNKEYFDVHELCTEFDSVFGMHIKDEIELQYIQPKEMVKVFLDKNRFRQILNNFLSNAVKYTSAGKITFGYKIENNGMRIFVKDTGIGISEENKKYVFQRFKKFDDFAQGTGLGLSICKALCDLQGGDIGFESELGKGSMFWCWVPCEMEVTKPIKIDDETVNKDGRLNILVAEDIDSNYMLMREILKDYNLTRASNGVDVVELCKTNSYDVIFMDIKMPIMNGFEAAKVIREFDKKVTIIALTANATINDKLDAKNAGCSDFIAKPIRKSTIISAIKRWVKE